MSRTSSTYVSPNLGPTTPWGQQTSTGVFRPPPPILHLQPSVTGAFAANPSREGSARHHKESPPCTYMQPPPPPAAAAAEKENLLPSFFKVTGGEDSAVSSTLQPNSPPFYPQFHSAAVPQQYHHQHQPTSSPFSIEKLMKMISYTVHMEEDNLYSQKESNRVLEAELKREQQQRRETQSRLDQLEKHIEQLTEIRLQQVELLALGSQ